MQSVHPAHELHDHMQCYVAIFWLNLLNSLALLFKMKNDYCLMFPCVCIFQEALSLLETLNAKKELLDLAESKILDNPADDEMDIIEGIVKDAGKQQKQ